MKNVCEKDTEHIPARIKKLCNKIVNKNGMIIIDKQKMDPAIICQKIKLCPKPATKVNLLDAKKIYEKLPEEILAKESVDLVDLKPAELIELEKKGNDSIGCSLCIYAAQLMDNFLKNNKTTNEIKQALKLVCNYFPAGLSDEVS